MPISFPMSLADFTSGLRWSSSRFHLGEARSTSSETEGGAVLEAQVGERLWEGELSLSVDLVRDAELMDMRVSQLSQPGRRFYFGSPYRKYPAADPDGSSLGVAAVTVAAIGANRRMITLSGAPVGYALSAADHVSVSFGQGGAARSYHRIVTGGQFAGSPSVLEIEVEPFVPRGVNVGDAVKLVAPELLAMIKPRSVRPREVGPGGVATAFRFEWMQDLG